MGAATLSAAELSRLPLGATDFSKLRLNDQIYVDKTDLLYPIALCRAEQFLSRPCRFGKSLLLSTFKSLFSKGLEDFHGLAIEKLWHEDKTYPVVHLNFATYRFTDAAGFRRALCDDLALNFGTFIDALPYDSSGRTKLPSSFLSELLSGCDISSVVMLIDDYDAPLTHTLDRPELHEQIRCTVSTFFYVLKSYKANCRFTFITGMSRLFPDDPLGAPLDYCVDLSLRSNCGSLLGFTEDELHRYFDPYVRNAAAVLDLTADEVYSRLKARYGGYLLTTREHAPTLYHPASVLSFLSHPERGFANYWYSEETGLPALLASHLKVHPDEIRRELQEDYSMAWDYDLDARYDAAVLPADLLLWQSGLRSIESGGSNLARLMAPNEETAEAARLISESVGTQRAG